MPSFHNQTSSGTHRGWSARHAKALEKIEKAKSPMTLATSRVRQAHVHLAEAQGEAERAWRAQHDPRPIPLPSHCHPDVVAILTEFLNERGITDCLAPLERALPLSSYVEIATAKAKQEIAEAERDLAKLEAQEAQYAALMRLGPAGLDAVLVKSVAETGEGDPSET